MAFSHIIVPNILLTPLIGSQPPKVVPQMRSVPLVSFCDLPMSLIRKHLKEYGNFGIGLDKKWGLKNRVAPVIYSHPKAQTRQPILHLTAKAAERNDETTANDLKILATYTKPISRSSMEK